MMRVNIVVPTYNAGALWPYWIESILAQSSLSPAQVLVIDSGSSDNTLLLAQQAGFQTYQIAKSSFDHGATRQLAVSLLPEAEVIVFLTQDALLADSLAVERLIAVFSNVHIGCAYGRQLPHRNAQHLGAHARLFNYPNQSYIRSLHDVPRYGIKTAFLSNSFAAYRVSALQAVGGFPKRVILGEDMVVAARMLALGYHVAYVAQACVFHSHDYTLWQEFKRYFDIGVLHAREYWLLEQLGSPQGEGKRFVLSEWRYLLRRAPWLLPKAFFSTLMKWLGYRMGRIERKLPLALKVKLSMHKGFWS